MFAKICLSTPLRTAASFIPFLFLGACGNSTSTADASPPPFQAAGAPDQVCSTAVSAGTLSTSSSQTLPPQAVYGAAATLPVTDPAAAKAQVSKDAILPDALGEAIALASTSTPLVQGTLYNTPAWPVWWGGYGKPIGNVNCLLNGNWHKHMLISIYNNGQRLGFPDGIGRVHAGCYHAYEMHVHDVTGIIHMESDTPKDFKLGDWFLEWGQPLGRTGTAGLAGPVRFYIIENGQITRYDGDPAAIAMLPHREILIVAGSPLSVVPRYQWPLGI
jgi:hypothetical protein